MKKAFQRYSLKKQLDILERIEAIYDANDGRTDEEKSHEIEQILSNRLAELQEAIDSETPE